ncbi:hypothetical protein HMI54_000889 [Coelomomyces lativittatus]|nr:hypothetical protein HMI56_006742 [Coelomomyces lativittatus]KAJ1509651.1 hypothetical protein HMI55_007308 [Coelomomyces lativittatus]KAJ1511335.1 hypothetical protein HMI54_000889 [Coelomomyces lativittatus]
MSKLSLVVLSVLLASYASAFPQEFPFNPNVPSMTPPAATNFPFYNENAYGTPLPPPFPSTTTGISTPTATVNPYSAVNPYAAGTEINKPLPISPPLTGNKSTRPRSGRSRFRRKGAKDESKGIKTPNVVSTTVNNANPIFPSATPTAPIVPVTGTAIDPFQPAPLPK